MFLKFKCDTYSTSNEVILGLYVRSHGKNFNKITNNDKKWK